jgi:single-strand DNA-binding protein
MKSINRVTLLGNLGKDAELKYTGKGTAVTSFSVATNKKWKDDQGDWQEKTAWHNVVCWQKVAEAAANLKKGDSVFVEGELQTRNYEKNGQKVYVTEIVASDVAAVQLLNAKSESKPTSETRTASKPVIADDDIPF